MAMLRLECSDCSQWINGTTCSRIAHGLDCLFGPFDVKPWQAVIYDPIRTNPKTVALHTQVGGSHYKDMKIQPVEFIHANGIGYFEGCAIKYLSRWRKKNGIEDLKKAQHFIQLLIDLESADAKP